MPHTQLLQAKILVKYKKYTPTYLSNEDEMFSFVDISYAKVRYRFSISVKKKELLLMLIVLLRDVQGCALLSK